MNVDDVLEQLAAIERPTPSPFFAARTAARAREHVPPRRTPRFLRLYWAALIIISGSILMTSWTGIAIVIAATAIAAMPLQALRAVLRVVTPLVR